MAAAGTITSETIRLQGIGKDAVTARIVDVVGRRDDYQLTEVAPDHLRLSRRYRASWPAPATVLIGLTTLGLGLLVVLRRQTETCSILLADDDNGVSVRFEGRLTSEMLRRLTIAVEGATPLDPAVDGMQLAFDDGRVVAVAQGGVIGRNPIDDPDLPGGLLIRLDGETISKTHLSFRPGAEGIMVRDRASTAGSVIVSGTSSTACPPNVWTHVPAGSVIKVGDTSIRVVTSQREGDPE